MEEDFLNGQNMHENGETMVLNDIPEVKNDPDREARKSLPI